MGGVERGGHLPEDRERPLRLEPPVAGEQGVQVGALHVAHRDEEDAVRLSRLVDRDDIRMLEPGGGTPLLLEPLPEARVGRELGREHLDRDLAPVAKLLGEVDDPHAAAAEQRLDPEAGELGADAGVVGVAHRRRVVPCRRPDGKRRADALAPPGWITRSSKRISACPATKTPDRAARHARRGAETIGRR